MKIKFNPAGTHIRKGKLLIRLDLYPDITYKTYVLQYIDVFARELTEEESERTDGELGELTEKAKELQKLVPKKKQLNPFLCHFIAIDPDMTRKQLSKYIKKIFDKRILTRLDNILSVGNRKNELASVMRGKFGDIIPGIKIDEADIEKANGEFSNFEVII